MKSSYGSGLSASTLQANKGLVIGLILFVALIAFEIFNFDTTQFALESLLGQVKFVGLEWATILAVAFCAIDFAGLNRLFTPEGSTKEQREVWFLMGAWLLGATMNAVMTWWAVSVTLLNNNLGNEVLGRDQILRYVPIFVAILVWLTRILFIGSFSIAGETIFGGKKQGSSPRQSKPSSSPRQKSNTARNAPPARIKAAPSEHYAPFPDQQVNTVRPVENAQQQPGSQRSSRVRQRPPMPNSGMRRNTGSIQARSS